MSKVRLTKEEKRMLNRTFWRWNGMAQAAKNYEKLQCMGYLFAMLPFIKEKYKNKEDQITMAKEQNQFFNTHVTMGNLILGIDLAVENEKGIESKDMITGLKTGLMGPMAGIGDTLFTVIIGSIFGSIAAYMALEGSPVGAIGWIIVGAACTFGLARWFLKLGYVQGQKIISSMGTTLKNITDAAVILGITVIGALVPSVIKVQCPLEFTVGESQIILQDYLDKLMPNLVPALLVGLAYWLLGRKNMTSTKLILITVVLGIVLYNLKILG